MVPLIDEWHITDIALALFIFKFFETNVRQASVDRDSRFVQTNRLKDAHVVALVYQHIRLDWEMGC